MILTSYSEAGLNNSSNLSSASYLNAGETFKLNDNSRITHAAMWLNKAGSPTGDVTYNLYAHSGTYGSTGVPTGSVLVSSATLSAASIVLGFNRYELAFSSSYLIAANTPLVLICNFAPTFSDVTNYVRVGNEIGGTYGGNYTDDSGGSFGYDAGQDMCFEISGVLASPVITGVTAITGIYKITF